MGTEGEHAESGNSSFSIGMPRLTFWAGVFGVFFGEDTCFIIIVTLLSRDFSASGDILLSDIFQEGRELRQCPAPVWLCS